MVKTLPSLSISSYQSNITEEGARKRWAHLALLSWLQHATERHIRDFWKNTITRNRVSQDCTGKIIKIVHKARSIMGIWSSFGENLILPREKLPTFVFFHLTHLNNHLTYAYILWVSVPVEEAKREKEALWPRFTGKVEWLNAWDPGCFFAREDKWGQLFLSFFFF